MYAAGKLSNYNGLLVTGTITPGMKLQVTSLPVQTRHMRRHSHTRSLVSLFFATTRETCCSCEGNTHTECHSDSDSSKTLSFASPPMSDGILVFPCFYNYSLT